MRLAGHKAALPPLGLITVAALLPDDWELRLVDRNVTSVTDDDWAWAEIVLISGMLAQTVDFLETIREAKQRDLPVAVGGPYATSLPADMEMAGADWLVLDEGEITIPLWLESMARGDTGGTFRSDGELPDVTTTPIPLFELLDREAYGEMSVQYSRGCPFLCEFCDIIVLYGRKARTKTPEQLCAELERLYELGWRRSVFVVDDNFIGNKNNVKAMLPELARWQADHGFPFTFATEASVDLAKDQSLMDLMTAARFGAVFLGIETPDPEKLAGARKLQNTRDPLGESVDRITASGLRIMAGFIVGFDGETAGAAGRIVDFVTQHAIPTVTFSMLQALPGTALTKRLADEGRLRETTGDLNQTTLMNFVPTRPLEEIAREYMASFWDLYDPRAYLDRAYRHYRVLGTAPCHNDPERPPRTAGERRSLTELRGLVILLWRQGVVRATRGVFWRYLWDMFRHNRGGVASYLGVCAHYEHFARYRRAVRDHIGAQLEEYLAAGADPPYVPPEVEAAAEGAPDSSAQVA